MILFVAWAAFCVEVIASAAFGVVFWRAWSRSAMKRTTALAATAVYAVCCMLCLVVTFFVPL